MDFILFLAVNAVLFIRPSEIVPSLDRWPIYNAVIISNLVVAAPSIINHLRTDSLARSPATVCVLGVFLFSVFSHIAHFDLWSARSAGWEFGKVVAYFLLFICTVSSPRRYFTFIAFLVSCILLVNALAVLHYHNYINIPALSVYMDNDYDELTGQVSQIPRMRSTGMFNDPNDLSMIIVAAIILCIAGIFHKPLGIGRVLLALPTGFLLYCLSLTQSRGGLLALVSGCGVITYCRLGAFRTGVIAAAGIPLLLAGFGGRQTDLGGAMSGGTGHARVELWSAGLQEFKQSPLFGIGYNVYGERVGQVAHNSFIHAFTELGFVGGMLFLALIYFCGTALWKLGKFRREIEHPSLRHLQPYVLATLVAYTVSMLSLSRCYVVPTYLVVGLGVMYNSLAGRDTSLKSVCFDGKALQTLTVVSIGFLALTYLYIKILFRMG